jgi:hypothetical protein
MNKACTDHACFVPETNPLKSCEITSSSLQMQTDDLAPPQPAISCSLPPPIPLLPATARNQTTRRREFQCLKKQERKRRAEEDVGEPFGMKD